MTRGTSRIILCQDSLVILQSKLRSKSALPSGIWLAPVYLEVLLLSFRILISFRWISVLPYLDDTMEIFFLSKSGLIDWQTVLSVIHIGLALQRFKNVL